MVWCEKGLVDDLKILFKSRNDFINQRSIQGWSPIIIASYNSQKDVVELLLEKGADINDTGENGTSVFMYAKSAFVNDTINDFHFLNWLLDKGALINHRDIHGRTVLDYIHKEKSESLYRFLLAKGAKK
jgi:methionyl-tRNA formyltransferase